MAKQANEAVNSPTEESVQNAVEAIEKCHGDLLTEKMQSMQRSKRIRSVMADEYSSASNLGINKKLLRKIIKERALERNIAALKDDLENDELSELSMLQEKLGEFANTPLGGAAVRAASGNSQAQAAAE
jgi:hypothetical protein